MAKKLDINTKDIILSATEHLIAKTGTNSFSLRDVASKADISLGTLYYHYKSKNDIILDLASLYLARLNEDYFAWLARHKDDLSKDRYLDVIFYKGVKLFDRGKIHLFLLNECIGGNKKLQNKYAELYRTWQENLKVGVKQVFPKIKEAETFAALLMMVVDGMIVQEVLKIEKKIDDQKIKDLLKGFEK